MGDTEKRFLLMPFVTLVARIGMNEPINYRKYSKKYHSKVPPFRYYVILVGYIQGEIAEMEWKSRLNKINISSIALKAYS